MVYHPDENESDLYCFEPERFLVPPMEGILRRLFGVRWGLILVSTPEHVDRHEILDFLANFALQQNYYSEFSAELGVFEDLEVEQRRLRTLDDVLEEASEVISEAEKKANEFDISPVNFSRNSDLVFIENLTSENMPDAVGQAMGGRLAVAGITADGSFPALGSFLKLLGSPHLVAASLMGIIGLNSVAKNCPHCIVRIEIQPTEMEYLLLGQEPDVLVAYEGKGCEKCSHTGTHGRILIHEGLEVGERVRSGIRDGMPLRQLRILAKNEGMRTLLDAAWDLVDAGQASLEEVSRIADMTDPESDIPLDLE